MTNIYKNEINLRQELLDTMSGKDFGVPKFSVFLQRVMRRDINNPPYTSKIRCSTCNKKYDNEGRVGCPNCDGVGYLWDEKLILGYAYRPQFIRLADQLSYPANVGRMQNATYVLITQSQDIVNDGDIVYILECNENGGIRIPIARTEKYLAVANKEMRLDGNKIEYNITTLVQS